MSLFLVPTVLVIVAATVSLVFVYAVRVGVLQPGTVEPFDAPGTGDPSADTIAGHSELVQTVLDTREAEWHVTTLRSLSQVEDLLDSLENHGVEKREVIALSNDCFAVRWQ
jgi:hypothetical protein